MRLRNINPLGAVDLPLIRREGEPFGEHGVGCLEPGEVFEVDDEIGTALLEQVGNYELADKPAPKPRTARKRTTKKKADAPAKADTSTPADAGDDEPGKGEEQ
jgi:hypothetical protein